MTTTTEFRWFWAWDDEKEEAWLREMAQKGWHFRGVGFPGYYSFEKGEPRDDVYRLDFMTSMGDKADYLALFADAGWEYAGQYGSWQYFRKTMQGGEPPEIFTDNESKATKYRRVLLILVVLLPIYINSINIVNRRKGTSFEVLTFILALFMFLYVYAMIQLIRRVTRLMKKTL